VEVGVELIEAAGETVAEGCFSGCAWIVITLALPASGIAYWLIT
jgi:hypothetical protein